MVHDSENALIDILNIFQLNRFTFADDFELAAIANKCPLNLTGADLYALCSDALLNAAKRMIKLLDSGNDWFIINVSVNNK